MKRYRHFTHPARGEAIPGRVVCIDADVHYEPTGDQSGIERAALVRWASIGWNVDSEGERRHYVGGGESAFALWQDAKWCLRRPGITLAVSWCASRLWGLVGLWEGIERGTYRFAGSDCSPTARRGTGAVLRRLQHKDSGNSDPSTGARGDDLRKVSDRVRSARSGGHDAKDGGRQGGPLVVVEDPPTILPVRVPGLPGTLQIVDVRNWGVDSYPVSASLADRVKWLWQFMTDMIATLRQQRWGGLRLTGGAQASAIWRHSYLTHPVWHHTHEETLQLEAEAYYGGRCECHSVGTVGGPLYHLDFRSAYGAVQRDCSVPVGLAAPRSGANVRTDGIRANPECHCATVSIRTEQPNYPMRTKHGIIYPVGEFVTTLAGPELARACARGHLLKVHSAARYNLAPALEGYAGGILNAIAEGRCQGNQPLVAWLKHLLVCLPGRFAQRDLTWRRIYGIRPPAPWCVWWRYREPDGWRRLRSLAWKTWEEESGGWAMDAAPAIAAWITSYQRVRLLDAIEICGWDRLYYCDTDSLVCSELGYSRLCWANQIGTGEPGRLRCIGVHNEAEIFGHKHYRLDEVVKCSGQPSGRYDPAGDCGTGWVHAWIKGALAQWERPEPMREWSERERREQYRARVVLEDGSTLPIRRGGEQ